MSKQIPWLRIIVEGLVIVGSILLAFGIDAAWDERQERTEEQEALVGLEADFTANLRQLRERIVGYEIPQANLVRLQAMSEEELDRVPPDSARRYATAILINSTFDPRDGTVDGLIASGRLAVIIDAPLRDQLLRWKGVVGDAVEEASDLRSASQDVVRRVTELGGPWRDADRVTRGESSLPQLDLVAAANDPELMARVRQKWFATGWYVEQLGYLVESASQVLGLVHERLPEPGPVASVAVASPAVFEVPVGAVAGLNAVTTFADGTAQDVTFQVEWSSSDTSVATITPQGIGRAVGAGESDLCATYRDVVGCSSVVVRP